MARDIDVPDSATPEEAAVIAAAVGAYLDAGQDAPAGDEQGKTDGWDGDSWRFRGRMEALQSRSVDVPT
ncbi:MAG: acc operon protein, partial [Halobacteriales archaeon]